MLASDLAPHIAPSCEDVLDAMYFTSILTVASTLNDELPPSEYAFLLHFHGDVPGDIQSEFQGHIQGDFGIHCAEAAARTLAANFLGEDEDVISSTEIAEVIAELVNMLCGSILSRLQCSARFALSHPEPCAPSAPPQQSADIVRSTLNTDIGPVHIWLSLNSFSSTESHARGQA